MIRLRSIPLRALIAPLVLGLAAACNDAVEPRRYPYGVILVRAEGTAGAYETKPLAYFFREQALILPTSTISQDSCGLYAYQAVTTDPDSISGNLEFIDAGTQLTVVDTGGNPVPMPKQTQGSGAVVYTPAAPLPYEPGDSLQFNVPGVNDGFPVLTVKARTAEAFTLGAVAIPTAADQNVTVTWTPSTGAGTTSSKMTVSLRSASAGSNNLDTQVLCSLVDDGTHTIPAYLLASWRNSYNDNREVAAQRLRTRLGQVETANLLVFSTFTVVTEP